MKSLRLLLLAGLFAGATQMQAEWSDASIPEDKMMQIRANFFEQMWLIYNNHGANFIMDMFCQDVNNDSDSNAINATGNQSYLNALVNLYANGSVQDMYIYLYYSDDQVINLSNHGHAYNFRMYVQDLMGISNYITDLAPNVTGLWQTSQSNNTGTSANPAPGSFLANWQSSPALAGDAYATKYNTVDAWWIKRMCAFDQGNINKMKAYYQHEKNEAILNNG